MILSIGCSCCPFAHTFAVFCCLGCWPVLSDLRLCSPVLFVLLCYCLSNALLLFVPCLAYCLLNAGIAVFAFFRSILSVVVQVCIATVALHSRARSRLSSAGHSERQGTVG
jgi:hypothetical protein